jgi:uncharacterized protein (TIGR03435 family)
MGMGRVGQVRHLLCRGYAIALLIICDASIQPGIPAQAGPSVVVPQAFAVVSVRRGLGPADRAVFEETQTGLTIRSATVLRIIEWAFNTQERDVVGAPEWTRSVPFEVVAKTDGNRVSRAELRSMTKILLRERFGFEFDFERVERPIYALRLDREDGRLGPGLEPTKSKCKKESSESEPMPNDRPVEVLGTAGRCRIMIVTSNGVRMVSGTRATMAEFADALSRQPTTQLDWQIVDQTGLAAEFDFRLNAAPDPEAPRPTLAPGNFEFFLAMRNQLGLKLEPVRRGEVEVLSIRKISQPGEN